MNIDFYRNYIEIVEKGTLSAAARSLHVAQSALSNQLKQFEEEYGARLFIRSSRQMEPTDAGRILYKKAKDIISLVEASYKEINSYVEGAQGVLRIGITQSYPDNYLDELFIAFQKQNPDLKFEIYEDGSYGVIELLKSGVVEIGVVRNPGQLPAFLEEEYKIPEEVCLYIKKENPWIDTKQDAINIKELEKAPIAVSRGVESLMYDIFERDEINPVVMSVATSRRNPMMWAEAGVAAAIVRTGKTEKFNDETCVCKKLTSSNEVVKAELKSERSFVSVKNSTMSPHAKRFLDFVRATK